MTVFIGAATALGAMTVLSTYVGYAVTIIPRLYTQYLSCALFAIFGVRMLHEGWHMSPDEGQEELEEVVVWISKCNSHITGEFGAEEARRGAGRIARYGCVYIDHHELSSGRAAGAAALKKSLLAGAFMQACTLTFLAEWGDRSQIATIVLGAREVWCCVVFGVDMCHYY